MAVIKYLAGIPPIPAVWSAKVSALLDTVGIHSVTISSTRRTLESNSQAIFNNVRVYGVAEAMKLYNANMREVIKVYDAFTRAGRNQNDTIRAMVAKTSTLPLPVHCREQNEHFTVFDIPPTFIADNQKKAFENIMAKNASKFISPIKGSRYYKPAEPVYHIEFGGIKTESVVKTGGALLVLIIGVFFLLRR